MSSQEVRVSRAAKVSAIIVRACAKCGNQREMDTPCGSCGNDTPPETVDLGVIAATETDPLKRLKWALWGSRAANRRIKQANKS